MSERLKRLKELSRIKISKRKAAQMMYKEKMFPSLEAARSFVRRETGAKGKDSKFRVQWLTDIPTPIDTEFGVTKLPKSTDGILMLVDLHLPFHSPETIQQAIGMKSEYDTIIIQEVFDFYQLSRFDKTRTINVQEEQEAFFQLMDWIREECPTHRIIFQKGNHDERFEIAFMRKAQEFEGLDGMEFETIFNFGEYEVEALPMRNLLEYRGLYIGHGHEIGARGVPVSPARTFYLKTKGNFIGGHFHRTSEYITRSIKDDVSGCWSVGCACDLHPLYAPVNEWNNGFAIIRPYGDDKFRVKNIKIF